jgi:hypothetical protein
MDTHLDGLEHTQAKFHEAFDNHMEDVEDEVQVLKCDMEHSENGMGEMKRDMMDVKASINNAHTRIEKVGDHVDGFLQALHSNVRVVVTFSSSFSPSSKCWPHACHQKQLITNKNQTKNITIDKHTKTT